MTPLQRLPKEREINNTRILGNIKKVITLLHNIILNPSPLQERKHLEEREINFLIAKT